MFGNSPKIFSKFLLVIIFLSSVGRLFNLVYFFVGTGDVNARPGMQDHVLPEVNIPTDVDGTLHTPKVTNEDDNVLENIFAILSAVHSEFFRIYKSDDDIPDVKRILNAIKSTVFAGLFFVFSGITKIGTSPADSQYWKLAEQFGAECHLEINESTTHLITHRTDTDKVLDAIQRDIIVVSPEWILKSVFNWHKQDEHDFIPKNLPPKRPAEISPLFLEMDVLNKEIDECLEDSENESQIIGRKRSREDIGEDDDPSSSSDGFADELEHDLL